MLDNENKLELINEVNNVMQGIVVKSIDFDSDKRIIGIGKNTITETEKGPAPLSKTSAFKEERPSVEVTAQEVLNPAYVPINELQSTQPAINNAPINEQLDIQSMTPVQENAGLIQAPQLNQPLTQPIYSPVMEPLTPPNASPLEISPIETSNLQESEVKNDPPLPKEDDGIINKISDVMAPILNMEEEKNQKYSIPSNVSLPSEPQEVIAQEPEQLNNDELFNNTDKPVTSNESKEDIINKQEKILDEILEKFKEYIDLEKSKLKSTENSYEKTNEYSMHM